MQDILDMLNVYTLFLTGGQGATPVNKVAGCGTPSTVANAVVTTCTVLKICEVQFQRVQVFDRGIKRRESQ